MSRGESVPQKPIIGSYSTHTEIEERDQANNVVATYVCSPDSGPQERGRVDVVVPRNTRTYVKSVLNVFLPAGYPHSVTKDYLQYQIYDSLQAFSSSIAGLLSSRAVLEGIGVGDSHASPTAALLLSVLQDSMGRIATILFAHRLGTSLEPECKMYRLAADIFNDAAMIFDCLSPALPKASRVALLSLSSVLRSLCGVAAGSSKASLSAHFATQGNLGELNAKDSSQETIISLMGMLVGSLVVSHISSQGATWIVMIALLAIHLGTNYLAVRAVSMRTLNRQRANLVFSTLFQRLSRLEGSKTSDSRTEFPTPDEVSLQERVFEKDGVLRWQGDKILGYCQIGVPLRKILDLFGQSDETTGSYTGAKSQDFVVLLDIFQEEGYIMWYDEPRKVFLICLKFPSNTETQLHAWMHALFMAIQVQRGLKDESVIEALARTRRDFRSWAKEYEIFDNLRRVGWDLDTAALETRSGTRIRTKDGSPGHGEDLEVPWKF